MGKTYRKEKSWGPKRNSKGPKPMKPLDIKGHRDLPDYDTQVSDEYPFDDQEARDYYENGRLQIDRGPSLGPQDPETPKANPGQ